MSEVRLETTDVPAIGGTPYYGFAVMAHAEMLSLGLVDPRDPLVYPDDGAIVARAGDQTVGIVTYRYEAVKNTLWLCAAFVLADWRRRRIFRHMFEELIKVAEKCGTTRIQLGTLSTNEGMKRAAVAAGMSMTWVHYAIEIEASD